jgi:hypothetical protein
MHFHLYLNKISASQVLSSSARQESPLNCHSNCNPYNSRRIDDKSMPIHSLEDLYTSLRQWRVREESFGYLYYDPTSSRIYESDATAKAHISRFQEAETFEQFMDLSDASSESARLVQEMRATCI